MYGVWTKIGLKWLSDDICLIYKFLFFYWWIITRQVIIVIHFFVENFGVFIGPTNKKSFSVDQ